MYSNLLYHSVNSDNAKQSVMSPHYYLFGPNSNYLYHENVKEMVNQKSMQKNLMSQKYENVSINN